MAIETCELGEKQPSFKPVMRAIEIMEPPNTGHVFFVFYYTSQNELKLMRLACVANFINDFD